MKHGFHEAQIAMVCFCDLPLSRVGKHIKGHSWKHNGNEYSSKAYGSFGIGMSKKWGERYHLNPVHYVISESHLLRYAGGTTQVLQELYAQYKELWEKDPDYKDPLQIFMSNAMTIGRPRRPLSYRTYVQIETAVSNALAWVCYMKPYQDSTTGQLFYDEREWRYVVPFPKGFDGDVQPLVRLKDKFVPLFGYEGGDDFDIEIYKKRILEKYVLGFKPGEIKYIIVKEDSDIHDVVNRLKEFPEMYTPEIIDRLTARIITCEQIHEDC